jgi:hypothetical protein
MRFCRRYVALILRKASRQFHCMHQIVPSISGRESRKQVPRAAGTSTIRHARPSVHSDTIFFFFAVDLFRPNRTQWFPKPNAGSTTVLRDELDAGFFESASHILKGTRIWLPYSTLEVRNSLRGCFACL